MSRPKGQHSAPRGGPPRSWTNAELTDALQHVWNKKMTTSQASRVFGIPYNSLLMYVRGKYGKSLKLEKLRRDCISGPPIELLQMGISQHNNNTKAMRNKESKAAKEAAAAIANGLLPPRSESAEPDLGMGGATPGQMFNPFPPGFYHDFPFHGLPLNVLSLLPPDRHPPAGMLAGIQQHIQQQQMMEDDCKSDRSKHSLDDEYGGGGGSAVQPLALLCGDRAGSANDEQRERHDVMQAVASAAAVAADAVATNGQD